MAIVDFAIEHIRAKRPIFPGIPGGKIPAIKDPYKFATTNEKQVLAWWKENPLYNICLPCGTEVSPGLYLVVIDFDRKTNGFATKDFLADMDRNFPDTLTQITAGDGEHLLYTINFLPGNGIGRLGPGIDHRGYHGYIIGAGSWVGGREYRFKNKIGVNQAPTWLEDALRPHEKAAILHKDVGSTNQQVATGQAVRFLEGLPTAVEGERNHGAFKAAAQLKNLGVEHSRALELITTNWKTESPLETEELETTIASAYKNAKGGFGSKAPEAFFDVIPPPPEETKPKGPFEKMNDEYAFCAMGGTPAILWHTKDQKGKPKTEVMTVDGFHQYNANKEIMVGDRPIALSKLWMKSKERRTYQGMIFDPSYEGPDFFNLWQGFTVKPLLTPPTSKAQKSLDVFKEHVIKNVAQNNMEHANWLFTWIAHIFQKPGEKPRTGLVLRGKKGVGKSAIFDCVATLLGEHYLSVAGRRYITGNFNAHLEGKLLYVLEEAFWAKDKNADSILKDLVTNSYVQIERKGKESYSTRNLCRVVVVGNAQWLVDASVEERRYAVFEVTEGNIGDQDFFGRMKEDLDPSLLLKFFLDWDLSTANINVIPKTEALRQQKSHSGDNLEQWWDEVMAEGEIGGDWPERMPRKWVQEAHLKDLDARGIRGPHASCSQIDEFFKKARLSIKISQPRDMEHRGRVYVFPSLEVVRAEWSKYVGHKIDFKDTCEE